MAFITESVDSISTVGLGRICHICKYKAKMLINQNDLNFKIFSFHIRNLRQNIYLSSPETSMETINQQCFEFVKKVQFLIVLSFILSRA